MFRPLYLSVFLLSAVSAHAAWREQVVYQLNGNAAPLRYQEKGQIVTESWNRVVAVPYIVYIPGMDRVVMLFSCDYPHQAMILSSADRGATWSTPRFVHLDAQGKPDTGMGTSLTCLGNGRMLLVAGHRWLSGDGGETWEDAGVVQPAPDGKPWYMWDPLWADKDAGAGKATRLFETGYTSVRAPETGPGYQQGYIRWSDDLGKTWAEAVKVPQWEGVSEVALLRAKNGDLVGACRTDMPAGMKGIDHLEGLGVSISKDNGQSWSAVRKLYNWGRHHPSMVLLPDGAIVMTYVARMGYKATEDGRPQFGVEAVVSRDNGQTWDLDHRYILRWWEGNRTGPDGWWASCQATSSVLLPDGSILTVFGTGYRSQPNEQKLPAPRDAGLVLWRLHDAPLNDARTVRDAPFDSDTRNLFDPKVLQQP